MKLFEPAAGAKCDATGDPRPKCVVGASGVSPGVLAKKVSLQRRKEVKPRSSLHFSFVYFCSKIQTRKLCSKHIVIHILGFVVGIPSVRCRYEASQKWAHHWPTTTTLNLRARKSSGVAISVRPPSDWLSLVNLIFEQKTTI